MRRILFYLLLTSNIYGSVPEFFAASAKTAGIAGQATGLSSDAENNYYAASLLAFSNKVVYSANIMAIHTSFTPINNIVLQNAYTSANTGSVYGNADTNYELSTVAALHFAMPLFQKLHSKLAVSVFLPVTKLLETSTGDPYQPEYVFYKSRFARPQIYLNTIFRLGEKSPYAISIGALTGFAASAETFASTRLSGDASPSWGKAKVLAKPSFGLLASISYQTTKGYLSFAFQQELQSNFDAAIVGQAPLGGSSSIAFNLNASSMIGYDPMILRLSYSHSMDNLKFLGTVEYQYWGGYSNPTLKLASGSIINPSKDFEPLNTKNIIVPKIGVEWRVNPKFILRSGYMYRPTPLVKDHTLPGNSLDTDVHALSLGVGYLFNMFSTPMEFNLGLQYYYLAPEKVNKIAVMENGSAGQPVGYGGYDIGGSVQALSMGLKWGF